MALITVEALTQTAQQQAEEYARHWGVTTAAPPPGSKGVKVVVSETAVGLGFVEAKRGKPYFVDFLTQEWRGRLLKGLPRNHIFRRAIGVHDGPVSVIDATAGFGQDAMLAVSLGCDVTAVEKSNVVITVLRNGIERAREDESLRAKFAKMKVVEADAEQFLAHSPAADVVYLDPMFTKPKKSAKSPKEMQLLQDLLAPLPTNEDLERLFLVAYAHARHRVVIKQPLKAKALGRTPTHTYKGQSIRYDVYVK